MTHKVAISMPNHVFRRLERARRARKLTRSAAIQGALESWLGADARSREAREYLEGYRRIPEEMREAEAWIAAEAWGVYEEP
jgi:hypothetical protein